MGIRGVHMGKFPCAMFLRLVHGLLSDADDNDRRKKQKVALLYDQRPVRTVQVTIDTTYDNTTINADYLRGYFDGVLGPVSNVSFACEQQEVQNLRTAYVTFVMPEDAARAIAETNFKFTIEEADHRVPQPKIDPNALKFEELNDDVLLKIISYLELIDIVNLGKTSTRFGSFTTIIYRKMTHFSFGWDTGDSSINESNVEAILEALGGNIKSIAWRNIQSNHLIYLSKHCSNVTDLSLNETIDITLNDCLKNLMFFAKIEKLEVDEYWISEEAILKTLTSSKVLKCLELCNCNNLRGNFFAEWKNSELEALTIKGNDDSILRCDDILDFVRNHKLAKFSYDGGYALQKCLNLPPVYLAMFKELDLNYEEFENSGILDFKHLRELRHLGLNCYFENFSNCNNLLLAVSQIPALTSLTVGGIIVDDKTLRCLGTIKGLRKIRFDFFDNKIGGLFYSSLYAHLPAITEIMMYDDIMADERDDKEISDINRSICAMIQSIRSLVYFGSSSMTWELLDSIFLQAKQLQGPPLEIGVSESMFNSPGKKRFAAAAKGVITLSMYKEPFHL